MKKLLLVFFFAIISLNSLFAQPGWFIIRSEIDFAGHWNFFTDDNTGYDVGGNWAGGTVHPRILKTTNAGVNWFEQITPQRDSANFLFRCVYFIDANTGFVTMAYAGNPNIGRILKTTNGGNLWSISSLPVNNHMTFVYFPNSSTGYATGLQTILKTTDAGETWTLQNSGAPNYLFGISFTSENTGYVVGNIGLILKTTDGGSNWIQLASNTSQQLWGIDFADANTGTAVGGSANNTENIILRTTDAGLSWNQIPYTGSTCLLWSVRYVSPSTGWIIGWCNQIIKTTDGGLTWHNQASPTTNWYRTCFFTSTMTGYTTGEDIGFGQNGYILKTTDGGGIFVGTKSNTIEIPTHFILHQNYPNPFNPTTNIKFDIPSRSASANGFQSGNVNVRLVIYSVSGKEVEVIVNRQYSPGKYEVDWPANGKTNTITSGIYFYSLYANGELIDTKRMILLK